MVIFFQRDRPLIPEIKELRYRMDQKMFHQARGKRQQRNEHQEHQMFNTSRPFTGRMK
jgi:hypothetical protein